MHGVLWGDRARTSLGYIMALSITLGHAGNANAILLTAPYADNFDADANGQNAPNFTSTNGTWVVSNPGGSSGTYLNTISIDIAASSAVQVSNLGGGQSTGFVESATAKTDSTGAGNSLQFFGLAALGTVADVSNSTGSDPNSNFYFADVTGAGALRIDKVVHGGASVLGSGSFAGGLISGTSYTETLTGLYSGNSLGFTSTFSDGTTTQTISGTDNSTLLTGQFFGFRDRNATTSSTLSGTWDNYSLTAVPEPNCFIIAWLAVVGLISRRRRAAFAAPLP